MLFRIGEELKVVIIGITRQIDIRLICMRAALDKFLYVEDGLNNSDTSSKMLSPSLTRMRKRRVR